MARDLDVGYRFAREVGKTLESGRLEMAQSKKILPGETIHKKVRKDCNRRTHCLSDYVNSSDDTVPNMLRRVVEASDELIAMGENQMVYEIISKEVLEEYKEKLAEDF